ncbi:nickel pincer cofactor biosynthesis protein LarB [Halocatena pleomorpha]|uniref:Nickel pincer cofactor biosynthesis protein LarB n=1 Tax=Halocatena pleomorpha TaxID=1785090 RepID=A0A3P3R510_9EURY|nr:nickel pincer cofactor biosynthesis protein LarB [Halocatena pleomorpha]RRJ28566.1 nickel pincer cofactor biosynthesis protein LarB [Halocatena pleomorpha]
MRELLESVAAGELSVEQAEAELAGYATGETGRFDAARGSRTGVPEVILAAGKTPEETASMVALAVETTGRAIVTRVDPSTAATIEDRLADAHPEAAIDHTDRSETLVVHGPSFDPPTLDADVGVVTAGTSDAGPAGEAATIVREMGARVTRIDDVGVAGIARLIDRLEQCRSQDVLIVAAGREGALPTVLAGLVDVPLIGLPVSNGYGYGGNGQAALSGMLQSCTPIAAVNIDAGFTAGAQAGLFARGLDTARSD